MSFAVGVDRRIQVVGSLPPGWHEVPPSGRGGRASEVLCIVGPVWVGDRRPRIAVSTESGLGGASDPVEMACHDRWPHPSWGNGVVHQGMRVDGDVALAHDVYLFHDGRTGIRVELECELTSLFAVEEDVATILDALASGGAR
ncbi:MAG: hypothetical protein Q4G51_05345 [Dermatophilus congolensis]|nr:hypothetical protein [Dermatophilus congolensis]